LDKRLEKVIRSVFPIDGDTVDAGWTSDDIPDWDSVGHLNLIMEVEKEFNVKFEVEDMFEIENLGDITRILKEKQVL
jgi:acyl carrier protein